MQTIEWHAQNEATDADGFFMQGEAAFAAERAALAETGAPDTDAIEFQSIDAIDRDDAIVVARVTDAFAEWARREEITVE